MLKVYMCSKNDWINSQKKNISITIKYKDSLLTQEVPEKVIPGSSAEACTAQIKPYHLADLFLLICVAL